MKRRCRTEKMKTQDKRSPRSTCGTLGRNHSIYGLVRVIEDDLMPFEITVDSERRIAVVTHRGPSSREECVRVLSILGGDSRVGPEFGILIDVRQMEYEPSFEDLRSLGGLMASRLKNRIAFVTATPLQFGLARQSGIFSELAGGRADVFYEYPQAVRWLTGEPDGDRRTGA